MIYLYTEKNSEKNYILYNDLYFNLHTSNLTMGQREKDAIWEIDHARLTEDNHIETKYGIGVLRNLSSGCKTYLNVIFNPDKIISAMECGANVLDKLFAMDNIHLFMSYPERFKISENTQICFNESEIVVGRHGYEKWWTVEYERRNAVEIS